jgi:hypothetical protein
MFEKAYIKKTLNELQILGYDEPKKILLKFYRPVKRMVGYYLNPDEFAREIHMLNQAVTRIYDPNDPDQIYVGHLRQLLRKNKQAYLLSS